ncbi:hypothetical protein MCOR23_005099 [Pyricularia oryzae]|nr:hypothetical protein MCOR26_010597 [Pyricularia oryzae]KAI6333641.1 hypothetical protein MCOR28_010420 [Pyricularia oryzae]KAI6355004.1 hypothetical protein MCOR32_010388 [Pyricularia oryzae]KAI6399793.1 hypothetical protein MCOR23_005099 [Pyricularia oryzae]
MVSLPPMFNRRRRHHDGPELPTHNKHSSSGRRDSSATRVLAEEYSMRRRPSIKLWIKLHWLDLLTMAIFGAITLGIFQAPLITHRPFPVRFNSNSDGSSSSFGDIVYPEFAYPHRPQIVPNWAATMAAMFFPILVMALAQIRVRSFWDFSNGVIGLLNALVLSTFCQILLKWLIGGLRPNFYDTCKPDLSLAASRNESGTEGIGYGGIMYTTKICTGDKKDIDNALESWPSGHTTAAFAGFVYLSLYLNAKLKVFANHHPALWKLALAYFPILCAVLIAGSLSVDGSHNWYDILTGMVIGITFALSAYRSVYASVWNWRTNHIPLHRSLPFGEDEEDVVGMRWTMTRKAGWGRRTKAKGMRFGKKKRGTDGGVVGGEKHAADLGHGNGVAPANHYEGNNLNNLNNGNNGTEFGAGPAAPGSAAMRHDPGVPTQHEVRRGGDNFV